MLEYYFIEAQLQESKFLNNVLVYKKMSLIKLTRKERSELIKLHHHEDGRKFADRIKTILLLDDGYSYAEISKVLFLDDQTIRNYEQYR
jgi:DNA-binding NarL/FixJ family response regulator